MSEIFTHVETVKEFQEILQKNPGLVLVKFGAEWCGPCKKIDPLVTEWFSRLSSETVQCYMLDVDENFELYGFLKNKKMVNGIPAILCYARGTTSPYPDDSTAGSDIGQTNAFFTRCIERLHQL